ARNCKCNLRCIKCNGTHPTYACGIKTNIQEPVCINCKESGHLASWLGCKAFPTIKNSYQQRKSYTQVARNSSNSNLLVKATEKPTTNPEIPEISDDLPSLLSELTNFLKEYPEKLKAAKLLKTAKTKEENKITFFNSVIGN
ncbi:hypothetical protein AVEN_219893-1, partial [Araneus ventricosus]